MVEFEGRILIIGCGSVSQCMIPLLFNHISISPNQVTVLDFVDNRDQIQEYISKGLSYIQQKITPENYQTLLQPYLSKGDLLIDLGWNIDTIALINWCHHQEVLYVNTSVEVWDPYGGAEHKHPTELTLYHRQMQLKQLQDRWEGSKKTTAIVDHGANPGLISHFTKQGLIEIAEKILNEKPDDDRRPSLEKALENLDFAHIAYLTGVKTIHISERDTQITNSPKQVNEFVNTWSVEGFIEEGIAPAEVGWGTHERSMPKGAYNHFTGPGNQICLAQKGIKTWVRSWVPSGPITGMVIRHGEAYGLSLALTVWKDQEAVYRPTVHYAYCPCDSAINSLHEIEMRAFVPQPQQRILKDHEILSGVDELGALLLGHDFGAWWTGSILDIEEARRLAPGQNATTVQVAIGVIGAIVYAIKNPRLGVCLPEDLDHREIINIAKPYLGKYVSQAVSWSPLNDIQPFLDFQEKPPSKEEEWQFSTFLISPRHICESQDVILF